MIDKETSELAQRYLADIGDSTPASKFTFELGPEKELTALLMAFFAQAVKNRGVRFQYDANMQSKIEKVIKWMYQSPKRGLFLYGSLGNGKTTMLKALDKTFSAHALMFTARDIFNYFVKNNALPECGEKTILLIDDLGEEPPVHNVYGVIRHPLTEMLMQRYASNSVTVITTNLPLDRIREVYGERLYDRMKETYNSITYREPSYRK